MVSLVLLKRLYNEDENYHQASAFIRHRSYVCKINFNYHPTLSHPLLVHLCDCKGITLHELQSGRDGKGLLLLQIIIYATNVNNGVGVMSVHKYPPLTAIFVATTAEAAVAVVSSCLQRNTRGYKVALRLYGDEQRQRNCRQWEMRGSQSQNNRQRIKYG